MSNDYYKDLDLNELADEATRQLMPGGNKCQAMMMLFAAGERLHIVWANEKRQGK